MDKLSNNKDSMARLAWKHKVRFTLYVTGISFLTFLLLYVGGFIPSELHGGVANDRIKETAVEIETEVNNSIDNQNSGTVESRRPEKIQIDAVGVDVVINNPNSTSVSVLDQYLTRGAVRYPGSGLPGKGNMFLFAHSTGFKVVQNKAYQAFNGIEKLVSGEEIKVTAGDQIYIYHVRNVRLTNENEAFVTFSDEKSMLTLSTCNSFGEKQERYVVEADFVGIQ